MKIKNITNLIALSLLTISCNAISSPYTDDGNSPIKKFENETFNLDDETITSENNYSHAIYAFNSKGTIKNTTIKSEGSSSAGIVLENNSDVTLDENISINTKGNYSYGLEVVGKLLSGNNDDKTGASKITTGNNTILTITTVGKEAHGLHVRQGSSLDLSSLINSTTRSSIKTSGEGANGLHTNTFSEIKISNVDFEVENATGFDIYGSGDVSIFKSTLDTNSKGSSIYSTVSDNVLNLIFNQSTISNNNGNLITNFGNYESETNITLENKSYAEGTSVIEGTNKTNMTVTDESTWIVLDNSTVTNLTNINESVINLTNKTSGEYTKLTVTGDYTGGGVKPTFNNNNTTITNKDTSNGTIYVNTVWNNDETTSKTDSLVINGTATGYTEIKTKDGIISGDITNSGTGGKLFYQSVIYVGDHELGSNSFYGFAETTGAGLARLVQNDSNNYTWFISGTSSEPSDEDDRFIPVNPVNPKVPEAVLMPKANLNAGYSILGTLHERVSEQQVMAWDNCSTCQVENNDGQVWGRFIGNYNKSYGKDRYDYRSKLWGVQFGVDFNVNYDPDNKSRSHTGVMLTYAKDNLSFYDSKSVYFNTTIGNYAEKNAKTGHGQSDIYSLGAYHTYYDENGSYMDFVGMFNYIRNKYNTSGRSNDENHAYGIALSAEMGRPFAITNNGRNNGDWFIEPQAQLIYQYLSYNDYKTANDIKVDQHDQQGLRGRIGARIAYNQGNDELKTQTIYFTGNIIHDFLGQKRINFGTSHVSEKNNRTAGEVGVGIQLPLAKTSYVYFDTRYYHSLGNSSGKTKAFSGTLGLKYFW